MDNVDLIFTSIETITAFDIVTGNYLFTLDELQGANISQSEDSVDITGKMGRKLSSLKRNKAVTITATNGVVSGGLLEAQTGSKFNKKETVVLWTDYLTVNNSEAMTSWKAVGTVGAEIEAIKTRNSDGGLVGSFEQAATVAEGKFTYDPETKKLAFHTDVKDGTEIVVYYKRRIIADTLDNKSDVFSRKGTLYIDAMAEDKCSNVYRVQYYVPKADFSGTFDISLGENQTLHNFSAESLVGACGAGGNFWTYTVFGVNTTDE